MHCAGASGLFGREFVSVDRSVNKHSFQTCLGSLATVDAMMYCGAQPMEAPKFCHRFAMS